MAAWVGTRTCASVVVAVVAIFTVGCESAAPNASSTTPTSDNDDSAPNDSASSGSSSEFCQTYMDWTYGDGDVSGDYQDNLVFWQKMRDLAPTEIQSSVYAAADPSIYVYESLIADATPDPALSPPNEVMANFGPALETYCGNP